MQERPITVVELIGFLRSAERAGIGEAERAGLIDFMARNPLAGVLIKGTGGLRKLRWARPGAGKSGGYRAIYYFHDRDAPVYAFLAYGKSDQTELTAPQRQAASALVSELKQAIREQRTRVGER